MQKMALTLVNWVHGNIKVIRSQLVSQLSSQWSPTMVPFDSCLACVLISILRWEQSTKFITYYTMYYDYYSKSAI